MYLYIISDYLQTSEIVGQNSVLIGLFRLLSHLDINLLVIILERVFLKFIFWNNFRFTEKLRKYNGELLLILYPDFINFEHLPHLLYHSLCPFTYIYIYMHTYMHIYFFILSHLWIGCLHLVPLHWIFSVYFLRVRIFKSMVLILWFLNSAFLIITIFRENIMHTQFPQCLL